MLPRAKSESPATTSITSDFEGGHGGLVLRLGSRRRQPLRASPRGGGGGGGGRGGIGRVGEADGVRWRDRAVETGRRRKSRLGDGLRRGEREPQEVGPSEMMRRRASKQAGKARNASQSERESEKPRERVRISES